MPCIDCQNTVLFFFLNSAYIVIMNIVFYSTNPTRFCSETFHHYTNPPYKTLINEVASLYPDDKLFIASQAPGIFLFDENDTDRVCATKNVTFIPLQEQQYERIADELYALAPDIAVAASFWTPPFDWLSLNDALVAENLSNRGINVISNSVETQMLCFDKKMTHDFLKSNGFHTAKSLYIRHSLFWAERNTVEVKENVYKDYIFREIKKLQFPIVIKDTVGLSSFSVDVLRTFNEAKAYLTSKKNNGDRLIDEFIFGEQFGAEVYGRNGQYEVFGPFKFSVNQYGITSPKQSIRFGPIVDEKYSVEKLKQELLRLATLLKINGVCQVDLVFSDTHKKWFIIEVNPRLSGMTKTVSTAYNFNPLLALLDFEKAFGEKRKTSTSVLSDQLTMSIKLPLLSETDLKRLFSFHCVKSVSQSSNDAAKQRREKGFCEVIVASPSKNDLKHALEKIEESFSTTAEKAFFTTAHNFLAQA